MKLLFMTLCVVAASKPDTCEQALSELIVDPKAPPQNPSEAQEDLSTPGGCGCGHALNRQNIQKSSLSSETSVDRTESSSEFSASDTASDKGETEEEAGLVHLKGGEFIMGANPKETGKEDGEGPPRRVRVNPFSIGKFEVSNKRFESFVRETGYVTEAEKFGWSFGVEALIPDDVKKSITQAVAAAPWWLPVDKAFWRHPNGPGTDLHKLMNHPVTQVSFADAEAFCAWSVPGGRLPTEAEWEFAVRGNLERNSFPWGEKLLPEGKHRCNIWQSNISRSVLGKRNFYTLGDRALPLVHEFYNAANSLADGYLGTAPVDAYGPQNMFGLYNMVGNVWEWVSDWYSTEHSVGHRKKLNELSDSSDVLDNPKGPSHGEMEAKVKRGGSFLCHVLTCYRYRTSARMMLTPDSAASNVGFRCAGPFDSKKEWKSVTS